LKRQEGPLAFGTGSNRGELVSGSALSTGSNRLELVSGSALSTGSNRRELVSGSALSTGSNRRELVSGSAFGTGNSQEYDIHYSEYPTVGAPQQGPAFGTSNLANSQHRVSDPTLYGPFPQRMEQPRMESGPSIVYVGADHYNQRSVTSLKDLAPEYFPKDGYAYY
jgi:hypothetical protein